ncbi:MAG TPA: MOSC domain-containing protein [Ktedonosporobacter sp.]|nr:MOSC domain-containing protein [Ktedonosporobacter sp.]
MQETIGSLVALHRYPIKSMLGEELNSVVLTEGCLLGDRQYALTDPTTGKVASAKNPRKWPRLFEFRASFTEPPQAGSALPPVRVTLPDGSTATTNSPEFNTLLSCALEREVILQGTTMATDPSLEEYWPEVEGLAYNDVLTDEAMPNHTFFDLAPIHILTTATIDQFRELYPQGRFEVKRFRPNIVIEPAGREKGFLENNWIGRTLAIGDEVRLSITAPCPRCVMTTLPQGDLPRDLGILRTAVRHNNAYVGVYATVQQGGTIRRGDSVILL